MTAKGETSGTREYLSRVVGPPGCGKTTYLSRQVRLAWEAGNDVMVCSLTRTAAAEVAGRDLPIPRECIGTLHSQAWRRISNSFLGIADTAKFIGEWNQEYPAMALSGGDRDLEEDNGAPLDGRMPGDDAYQAMNVYRARMIDHNNWPITVRAFTGRWEAWKKREDLLDFTDMLEIALDGQATAPGDPQVIFCDESQDLSALEMSLLFKWGRAAGRLVVVGDPWQGLYQWRGSDPDVFFSGEAADHRVLGQSYRVPRAVHASAMGWIQAMPGYEPIDYSPTDVEGLVAPLEASWKDAEGMLDLITDSVDQGKSVMVLASCAYMLTSILKMLREEGIPFHNSYRLKNGAWNPLARRRGGSITSCDRLASFLRMGEEGHWTRDDLKTWLSGASCSRFLPSAESWQKFEPRLINLTEEEIPYGLAEALIGETAIEASMSADMGWYQSTLAKARQDAAVFPCRIAQRYGSEALKQEPLVTIGTIHSVKGGEASRVIVAPDLSQRGVESWGSGKDGRAATYRLFYVAMTRAKEELHILRPVSPSMAVRLI
jgi:DNA helicase II / ATP-dependent DNA helicase PcrA